MLSSAQCEIVLQSLPDPAFVISRTGWYVGYFGGKDTSVYTDGSALVGRHASDFFPPTAVDYLLQGIDLALKDGRLHVVEYPLSGEKLVAPESGSGPIDVQWFEARLQALPFQVDGEDVVLWVAHNITKRYRLELELKRLSETDALTGLSNRRAFEAIAKDALTTKKWRPHSLALLMIDIDHFKRINDKLGHLEGDAVLARIAVILNAEARESDTVARWGGEEFAILLPEVRLAEAGLIGERVRMAAARTSFGRIGPITVSLGLTTSESANDDVCAFVARADEALYRAKKLGRNRLCISAEVEDNRHSAAPNAKRQNARNHGEPARTASAGWRSSKRAKS
jgi:diguanylate cyclase (GGDEF)-like protein